MPQLATTQKGRRNSRFPVGQAEALLAAAATSLCAHPAPSLPCPETIDLCSTSPAHGLFPERPYLSKTGCMYVCLFLNKNKYLCVYQLSSGVDHCHCLGSLLWVLLLPPCSEIIKILHVVTILLWGGLCVSLSMYIPTYFIYMHGFVCF